MNSNTVPESKIDQGSQSTSAAQTAQPVDNKTADQSKRINELKLNFICPLSQFIFLNPAQLNCGNEHFVEEEMGKKLLKDAKPCCPTCRLPITSVTPSRHMKGLVNDFLSVHPEFNDERYQLETVANDAKTEPVTSQPSADPFVPELTPEEMEQQHIVLQQGRRVVRQPQQNNAINGMAQPASGSQLSSVEAKLNNVNHSMFAGTTPLATISTLARPIQSNSKLIKVLIVGDASAAKSEVLLRFIDEPVSVSTIGVDFKLKTVNVNNVNCKLQIWDTAGQERFRSITTAYYRSANAVILMYSLNDAESFNHIRQWKTQYDANANPNASIYLVGNDPAGAESKRVVSTEQGRTLASELGVQFYECSSRNNININEIFNSICTDFLSKEATANQNAAQPRSGNHGKCTIM